LRRRSVRALRRVLVGTTGLTLICGIVALDQGGVLRDAERRSIDTRFSIRGPREAPDDVVLVAIDTATITANEFPFSRTLHARVIDRLRHAQARVIAYDVQFTEPSGDDDADEALVRAAQRADRIVLSTTEVEPGGRDNVFGGAARDLGVRVGNGLLPNDANSVLRRVAYDVDGLRAFGIVAAGLARGRPVTRADLGGPAAYIDYAGPPGTIRTVSFGDVLAGRIGPDRLRGKVVVVGPTAPSLQDVHPTSFGEDDVMSGAEIQANVIATALRGFPLRGVGGVGSLLLVIALGLVGPLAGLRWGPVRGALVAAAVGVAYLVAAQLAFDGGRILPVVGPLLALAVGTVGALWAGLAVGAFERTRVHDLFARFVPEQVVDDVLRDLDEDLRLGGERRIVSVMFSDVRGFTSFSETSPPDVVIDVLNRYLTTMSDVILDRGGTLISYMGDGIMAVFGAPVDQPDHADRALDAAREMTGPALERFNAWIVEQNHAVEGFRIGVGVNSGPVMAGNVGSERRLEYTAIGDVTNTAARLESMTKDTPHAVFIADATRAMLTRAVLDLQHVADLEVRGKQARVTVWTLGNGHVESGRS
jgi:adenylate cyclase